MPCEHVTLRDGTRAIVCTRRGRRRCSACKNAWADFSCDFPTPSRKSGTCDKALCAGCKVSVGDDLDYCPTHPRETPPGRAQFGMEV